MNNHQNIIFCSFVDFLKYSYSKAITLFHKITQLIKYILPSTFVYLKIPNITTITTFLLCILAINNVSAQKSKNEFSLPSLIEKAIAYHPSIKSNLLLEDSAKDEITTAKWAYFPTPRVSVSRVNSSDTDANYNGDNRVSILGLTQPLWAGGFIDASLERAKAGFMSAQSSTKVAEQNLALKVIDAYSSWYGSYLRKESYKKSKEEHSLLHNRLERRIKQGLSSSSDLNLANSRLDQAKAGLNAAIIQHKNSLFRLEEFLGISLDAEALIKDFNIIKFGSNLEKLKKQALLISPQIKQTKAEGLVVKAELKQGYSRLYPSINLKLERQWGNFNIKDAKTENRIFVELNSAFGAGLSNFSQVKRIKNRYKSLQEKIKEEKSKVAQQIKLDWHSSLSLKRQEALLKSSLLNTESVRKSYYRQFLAGRKSWQEVMNSIREVSQLESQLSGVYTEMISTHWRIFTYIDNTKSFVSKEPITNRIDRLLWYPGIKQKEASSVTNKILDFVSSGKDSEEKIIWYFDIDNAQNSFKNFLKKRDFTKFIKLFDVEK